MRRMSAARPLAFCLLLAARVALAQDVSSGNHQADRWRAEHRLIDMHEHVNGTPQHVDRAVKIMDAAGIGVAVNLGVGTVTPGENSAPPEFQRGKGLARNGETRVASASRACSVLFSPTSRSKTISRSPACGSSGRYPPAAR